MQTEALQVFSIACFGGALSELLKWYQLRESPNFPKYAGSPLYWLLTVLMIAAGGGLALLYGVGLDKPVLVANTGLSAPLIIKALADSRPDFSRANPGGPEAPGFNYDGSSDHGPDFRSILRFLAWH